MNDIELKIAVPNGWVVDAKVMPDGCCQLIVVRATVTAEDTICDPQKGIFKKVPASELRLADLFMKHQPKTYEERKFKELVETAIKNGLKDFWRPVYDPSFDDSGRICYKPGNKHVEGKSYIWWKKKAKDFWPERGSRLGTKLEYVAFLAVLMKELVASGKSLEWVWDAVCNHSEELGNYRNSNYEKDENTGSREVCGWYDLANTRKILTNEDGGYWHAGGAYDYCSYTNPLAHFYTQGGQDESYRHCCGWLVLTEGSTDH